MNSDQNKNQNQQKKKKEKTQEEKEEARRKAAEKKRLKKEEAAKLEEQKKQSGGNEEKETTDKTTKKEKDIKDKDKKEKEQKNEDHKKDKEAPKKSEIPQKEHIKNSKQDKKESKPEENENNNNKQDPVQVSDLPQQPKKKINFFAFTSKEERQKELDDNDHKELSQKRVNPSNGLIDDDSNIPLPLKNITSKDIIEMLNKDAVYTNINEEIVTSLLQISRSGINRQTFNCNLLMNSIKKFIDTRTGNYSKILDETKSLIDKIHKIIYKITNVNCGLENTCIYLKKIKEIFNQFPSDSTPEYVKETLISKIDEFISTKINTKLLIGEKVGTNIIKENDYILIYGKSIIFKKILERAVKKGIHFKVCFADNRTENQIKTEIEYLSKLGISVTYTYLNGISGIIDKITKVFIKGKAMMANGDLQGQVGTSLVACIANNFQKPVIAFCQSFKFWDKVMVDSLQLNNFESKMINDEGSKFCQMSLNYDITPTNFINMVCCDLGNIPASSVPVIIREFNQKQVEL